MAINLSVVAQATGTFVLLDHYWFISCYLRRSWLWTSDSPFILFSLSLPLDPDLILAQVKINKTNVCTCFPPPVGVPFVAMVKL